MAVSLLDAWQEGAAPCVLVTTTAEHATAHRLLMVERTESPRTRDERLRFLHLPSLFFSLIGCQLQLCCDQQRATTRGIRLYNSLMRTLLISYRWCWHSFAGCTD